MDTQELLTDLDKRHYFMAGIIAFLVIVIVFLLGRILLSPTYPISYAPVVRQLDSGASVSEGPSYVSEPSPDRYVPPGLSEKEDIVDYNPKRSKGEAACAKALEKFYGKPFPRVKPAWLVNPKTKRRLELDCYNKELGIALEYQGEHHYDPRAFGQGEEGLRKRVELDDLKYELCVKQNIYLITVPCTVPHHDIEGYVYHYLPENRKYRLDNGLTR